MTLNATLDGRNLEQRERRIWAWTGTCPPRMIAFHGGKNRREAKSVGGKQTVGTVVLTLDPTCVRDGMVVL